jgi:hypothetical protein
MTPVSDLAEALTAVAPEDAPSVRSAEFPVSAHAITTWCAAIGDDNPLYQPTRGADQMAPLPMLQTWAAPRTPAAKRRRPTVHARVREVARQHGYHSIVATDYELDHRADLRVGDLITERCWVDEVSAQKTTTLGTGHFVTIAFCMADQADNEIGSVRAKTFYYLPETPALHLRRPHLIAALQRPEQVDVTRTVVVAGAFASHDLEPVHHDHETARRQGLPDIIMSIVSTAGLVCAYGRRQWNIPRPRHVRLRLAAPALPGDVVTWSGKELEDATVPRGIQVQAVHGRGVHCTAVVAP